MKRTFLILLSTFILTGCGIEKLQTAANVVAKTYKSKNVTVGRSIFKNTGKGEKNAISLTLDQVEIVEKNNYPKTKVASISAKLLLDNLKPEDIGDVEKIIVTIKSAGTKSEFEYSISDLKLLNPYLKVTQFYLTDVKSKNYDNLITYIDTSRLSASDNLNLIQLFKKNDSLMGQKDNITVTGFDFAILEGENEKLKVVEVWAEMSTKNNFNRYHFYFNRDGKEIKVLGFGMNAEN